jgi:hypothetical protein
VARVGVLARATVSSVVMQATATTKTTAGPSTAQFASARTASLRMTFLLGERTKDAAGVME